MLNCAACLLSSTGSVKAFSAAIQPTTQIAIEEVAHVDYISWWRAVEEVAMKRLRSQHGLGAIGTLVSVLILGLLIYTYATNQIGTGGGGAAGGPVTSIDKGRAAACLSQRRTIERDVAAWSVEHDTETASVAALEAAGFSVPGCPEGGRYSISGQRVSCSTHP